MSALLTAVRARDVRFADRIDHGGDCLTVKSVESGRNRQVYIAATSAGGAPIVLERDPDERLSVWREES